MIPESTSLNRNIPFQYKIRLVPIFTTALQRTGGHIEQNDSAREGSVATIISWKCPQPRLDVLSSNLMSGFGQPFKQLFQHGGAHVRDLSFLLSCHTAICFIF